MKTYALLIGINNYNKISKLKGCTHDIEKIENYLNATLAGCEIKKLTDDKAAKTEIVNGFNSIKQKIGANDSFLFYFSGHGTREHAHPVWNETNKSLECIVCYDQDDSRPSDFLLADKELRYLIFELSKTGCHIVTIFDCCHSGGVTRNFEQVNRQYDEQEIRERRYAYFFPQRNWDEFIFSAAIDLDDVTDKHVNEFLPQGSHVQMAACESDESALEVGGEGVFTKTLLKVLKDTGGKISYYNLKGRIRQYLRFVYEQQPRIYTVGRSDEETQQLLFTHFLNDQHSNDQQFIAEAVYNAKKGWLLNFGAIHGISRNTSVDLIDPVLPGKLYSARIKEVFADYSLLAVEDAKIHFESATLKAMIKGLELNELILYIKRHRGDLKKLKSIADSLLDSGAGHFIFTEDETLAAYTLHVKPDIIYVTHPNETFRPLVQPIWFSEMYGPSSTTISQLTEYLKHISRWNYTKRLQNKADNFYEEPIKINITQVLDNDEKNIPVNKSAPGEGYADLYGAAKSRIRITLTSQTDQKLFVAVAYLSYNFRVYMNLLEGKVQLLNGGESVSLRARPNSPGEPIKDLIPMQLPDVVQEYNWPGYTETIKVIISNEEFDPEALSLDPLPSPYTLKDRGRVKERSPVFDNDEEDEVVDLHGWSTQTVHLKYSNIFYNKVDADKINRMLEWDRMAFFAGGLYEKLM